MSTFSRFTVPNPHVSYGRHPTMAPPSPPTDKCSPSTQGVTLEYNNVQIPPLLPQEDVFLDVESPLLPSPESVFLDVNQLPLPPQVSSSSLLFTSLSYT
jgi:hypothetical protein